MLADESKAPSGIRTRDLQNCCQTLNHSCHQPLQNGRLDCKVGFFSVSHIGELLLLYNEMQKTFSDRLKDFTNQFEMILEGEKVIAGVRGQLEAASEKENRIRKEVKKAAKKRDNTTELVELTEKLAQAEREKDLVMTQFYVPQS